MQSYAAPDEQSCWHLRPCQLNASVGTCFKEPGRFIICQCEIPSGPPVVRYISCSPFGWRSQKLCEALPSSERLGRLVTSHPASEVVFSCQHAEDGRPQSEPAAAFGLHCTSRRLSSATGCGMSRCFPCCACCVKRACKVPSYIVQIHPAAASSHSYSCSNCGGASPARLRAATVRSKSTSTASSDIEVVQSCGNSHGLQNRTE